MILFEAPPTYERTLALKLLRLADDSEEEIRHYLNLGRLFLLQEANEAPPIGQLLLLQPSASEAEIKSVSILAERQGQGLGSFLVKGVLSTLRQEGVSRVLVATSTADIQNIAFYQRLGFRCLRIERDAFTPAQGYPEGLQSNGILVRDQLWFDLSLQGA